MVLHIYPWDLSLNHGLCKLLSVNARNSFYLPGRYGAVTVWLGRLSAETNERPNNLGCQKASLLEVGGLPAWLRNLQVQLSFLALILRIKDMGDADVLKYEDILLQDSDLDTLRGGPCFLSDQIIAFYCTCPLPSTLKELKLQVTLMKVSSLQGIVRHPIG